MRFGRTIFTLGALVVAGMSADLFNEHRALKEIAAMHESLAKHAGELEARNERLSNQIARQNISSPMPTEQFSELLRLRGEVGLLRQLTNEISALQRDIQRLMAETDATQGLSFSDLSPADQFLLRQNHVQNAIMDTLLGAVNNYALQHDGQYPTNFGQLMASGDLQVTNFPGNLSLNDFEFIKPATTKWNGHMAILRNRIPIPKPGEPPVWVYLTVGGTGGATATSEDLANSGNVIYVRGTTTPN